jgi:DNA-binding response OmpR family regulator
MIELTPDQTPNDTPSDSSHLIVVGHLSLDLQARSAGLRGQPIQLTQLEYDLLACLARNAGRVVSRTEILREVWGCPTGGTPAQIKNCMWRLRQKIEPDPKRPRYLVTVYGHGYLMPSRVEGEQTSSANGVAPPEG